MDKMNLDVTVVKAEGILALWELEKKGLVELPDFKSGEELLSLASEVSKGGPIDISMDEIVDEVKRIRKMRNSSKINE